jgi:hypothetical protein
MMLGAVFDFIGLVSELKVHTDTDDVFVEFCIDVRIGRGDGRTNRCRVISATIAVIAGHIPSQIDKEVFDLGGPVVGKGPFQSTARGPTEFGIVLHGQAVQRRFHIRAGAARGVTAGVSGQFGAFVLSVEGDFDWQGISGTSNSAFCTSIINSTAIGAPPAGLSCRTASASNGSLCELTDLDDERLCSKSPT